MKCWNCGNNNPEEKQFCQKCVVNLYASEIEKRRRPLTEWEKQKLVFYRDEKKWIDHIKNRKIVQKNGVKTVVLTDYHGNIKSEVPNQPRYLWPKPKQRG